MSAVVSAWSTIFLVAAGIGLIVRRAAGLRELSPDSLFLSFWVGVSVATLLLQIWNLFRPVDVTATIALASLGAVGLCLFARELTRIAHHAVTNRRPLLFLFVLLGAWMANRAIGPCEHIDSGLYQVQAVRWASEFAIVPGLANLNANIGFNNSSALLAATLDVGFWYGRATHVFNSTFLVVLLLRAATSLARLLRADRSEPVAISLFAIAFAIPISDLAISPHISSITTDVPPTMLLLAAGLHLFGSLLLHDKGRANADLLALSLMVTCAVTWKVSSVACSSTMWLLAAWRWWDLRPRAAGASILPRAAPLLFATISSTLIIGVWLLRGIILSGYPLFPSSILPINVDWRVPAEHTLATHAWVVQFARNPTIRPEHFATGLTWIADWLPSLPKAGPAKFAFPCLITILAGGFGFLLARARAPFPPPRRVWLFFIPVGCAIAFWLATAPAPRFGSYMFWLLSGGVVGVVAETFFNDPPVRTRILLACSLLVWIPPTLAARAFVIANARGADALSGLLFIAPGPDHGLHPMPTQQREVRTLLSGDRVWVPVNSDLSWDGPLPITPFFNPHVAWRDPGNLRAGFRVPDGAWTPEIWPHYGSTFLSVWRREHQGKDVPLETTPAGTSALVAPRKPAPEGGRERRAWGDGVVPR